MKKYITTILLAVSASMVLSQSDCEAYPENHIPTDLVDAMNYMNCNWPDSTKSEFKNTPKSELFLYGGMGMRNAWGLWEGKNKLSKYFQNMGIYHPDDMSSIIIESFHRKLNNEPILLDQQVQYYIAYWEEVKEKDKITFDSLNLIFENKFNNFSRGDTVQIEFHLYKNSGTRIQQYPFYEEECNCLIKGIIKNKKLKKNKYFYGRYELHIKLISICEKEEITFWMEDTILKKGKKYKFFHLDNYRITKVNSVANKD
ncbi:MAG: DUF6794 domain-containing protein [Bacteroidota bacterium]